MAMGFAVIAGAKVAAAGAELGAVTAAILRRLAVGQRRQIAKVAR